MKSYGKSVRPFHDPINGSWKICAKHQQTAMHWSHKFSVWQAFVETVWTNLCNHCRKFIRQDAVRLSNSPSHPSQPPTHPHDKYNVQLLILLPLSRSLLRFHYYPLWNTWNPICTITCLHIHCYRTTRQHCFLYCCISKCFLLS